MMTNHRNSRLGCGAFLTAILLALGLYVGAYFAVSRVDSTMDGECREFSSKAAYDFFLPLRWIEKSINGRFAGYKST